MKSVLFEIKVDEDRSLVLPELDEAEHIFSLIDRDRKHLEVWLPWVAHTHGPQDTRDNLIQRIESFRDKTQASFYGTYKGDIIASVGFVSLEGGEGEIGYWLLSEHQGKGHITTFVKACVDYGFKELGLERIVIKCADKNVGSAAVAERLGFALSYEEEPDRERGGVMYPTLVYMLDKSDYL